jgi:hypothetical protein
MTIIPQSRSADVAAAADLLSTACPLCHTVHEAATPDSVQTGAFWVCARCGQTWDPDRLGTAAAYAEFAAAR